MRDYDGARTQDVGAFKAFFHAMLARGVYLPPSAFEAWFVSAAIDDAALDVIAAALPHAARAAAARAIGRDRHDDQDHRARPAPRRGAQPEKVLYGRLPGYRLSELGVQMAKAAAQALADEGHHLCGGQPAGARAADRRADRGPVRPAHRRRRAAHRERQLLRGQAGRRRRRRAAGPTQLVDAARPVHPVVGRAYTAIAARMFAALQAARAAAEGHEAVCVSHQLPIWTLRRHLERKRLWHDPRRRSAPWPACTSFHFEGTNLVGVAYTEPAAHLVAMSPTARDAKGA